MNEDSEKEEEGKKSKKGKKRKGQGFGLLYMILSSWDDDFCTWNNKSFM